MTRWLVACAVLVLCGCNASSGSPKPMLAQAEQKDGKSVTDGFHVNGRIIGNVREAKADYFFAAESQGGYKATSATIRSTEPFLTVTLGGRTATSGHNGQISGTDVELYSVGKSVFGMAQPDATRYVVVHFKGEQDAVVTIMTTATSNTKLDLPSERMCEVTKDASGNWQFGPIKTIDYNDPVVASLDTLARQL